MAIDVSPSSQGRPPVKLAGTLILSLHEHEVVEHVLSAWGDGLGGSIVTANVDILQTARRDPAARALVDGADLVVADGMPLRWAAGLAGARLPERVTGASLFWTLSEAAATAGQSVFVLGGPEGAAERAAAALTARYPGLRIAGTACPPLGFDTSPEGLDTLRDQVVAGAPGLVLVGLGFPKQERVSAHLRMHLPDAWYLGCGAAVAFAGGDVARAPRWMQDAGLEWLHRMAHEPRRLGPRYLKDDLPFALGLLGVSVVVRARRTVLGNAVPRQRQRPPSRNGNGNGNGTYPGA